MALASSSSSTGVPPGFRFHPTDEELLLYYLKKKVSFEKFELEVIREVDLNKIEPWDLQERCRIGSAPQNDWYFFSHKDRKYPTGSRTNRATTAGFWKATGRDKCIRSPYSKIGMRKTLVFYRGRAPHGLKTDWIMHEYRLLHDDFAGDAASSPSEDGWVVCRVFKKKCFFKIGGGGGDGSSSKAARNHHIMGVEQSPSSLSSHYVQPNHGGSGGVVVGGGGHEYLHHHHRNLYYAQMQTGSYAGHGQVQDLLTNHRPSGYDFPVLPGDSSSAAAIMKPYDVGSALEAAGDGACDGTMAQGGRNPAGPSDQWAVLDGMDGRFTAAGAAQQQHQMNQMGSQRGGGEMDLWGYGK